MRVTVSMPNLKKQNKTKTQPKTKVQQRAARLCHEALWPGHLAAYQKVQATPGIHISKKDRLHVAP